MLLKARVRFVFPDVTVTYAIKYTDGIIKGVCLLRKKFVFGHTMTGENP
jgi:hypothetical protein